MKWKLGEISGIGVFVHWSFWLLPAWILYSALGAGGGLSAGLASVAFVFAVFACVVMHEFGHAFAARLFGIGTRDITLYPIGGVASLNRIPRNPLHELVIALAGPAVNVVLAAGLFIAISLGAGAGLPVTAAAFGMSFLMGLLMANVILVVFNMLPAFPMDGGRVLRAFLAMNLPYARATEIAAKVGQAAAVVLAIAGLVMTQPTLILVAVFIFLAAQAEANMVRAQDAYGGPKPIEILEAAGQPWAARQVPREDDIIWTTEVRTVDPRTGLVRVFRYPPAE